MHKSCPVTKIVCTLSRKWTLLILKELHDRKKARFNELLAMRAAGGRLNSRTLSARLKGLERAGLVNKKRFSEIPPRVEYSLTKSGKELIKCFGYLGKWVKKWGR